MTVATETASVVLAVEEATKLEKVVITEDLLKTIPLAIFKAVTSLKVSSLKLNNYSRAAEMKCRCTVAKNRKTLDIDLETKAIKNSRNTVKS